MTPDHGAPRGQIVSYLFRSFLAVLCGILLFTALMAAFNKLAGIEAPARNGAEKPVEAAVCLAVAMLLTGYGVGRIAGRWEILVGAGVGVLMSIGAGRAHLSWQGLESSDAQMVSMLFLPPFAILGAWAARRMARSEAEKRAAETLPLPLTIRQYAVVTWFGFLLALGMTAAGVWIIRIGEASLLGWAGTLFFAGGTLLLGWQGITRRPQAIFREEGIEMPAFQAVIPWSEVVDAVPSPTHPIAYVRFRVLNPERYLSRLSPLQTALSQAGEAEPNIGVVLTGTPYTVEQICALVRSRVGLAG